MDGTFNYPDPFTCSELEGLRPICILAGSYVVQMSFGEDSKCPTVILLPYMVALAVLIAVSCICMCMYSGFERKRKIDRKREEGVMNGPRECVPLRGLCGRTTS